MKFHVPPCFFCPRATPESTDANVIANRPALAPSAGSSYATDDLFDAQAEWQAHIDAGRIKVR